MVCCCFFALTTLRKLFQGHGILGFALKRNHTSITYPPVHYIPRKDVDMRQLQRTSPQTYCPYKGECAYYTIPAGGERSVNAVWTYEAPYAAVSEIREYLAFYPDRAGSSGASRWQRSS